MLGEKNTYPGVPLWRMEMFLRQSTCHIRLRCTPTWVCSGSNSHTCAVVSPETRKCGFQLEGKQQNFPFNTRKVLLTCLMKSPARSSWSSRHFSSSTTKKLTEIKAVQPEAGTDFYLQTLDLVETYSRCQSQIWWMFPKTILSFPFMSSGTPFSSIRFMKSCRSTRTAR